jgi:Fe-S oxidoreductase
LKPLGTEEYCCGGPLWRTGQVEAAARQAHDNLEVLERRGIKTVITSCAECFGTLRGFYPRVAQLSFEVKHISEVVDEALGAGRLRFSKELAATLSWHDPCMLGRLSEPYVPWKGEILGFGRHVPPKTWRRGQQGVYDAPRRSLAAIAGVKVVEMVRNEENALCCGGGGGVREAFPEQARVTATERIREVVATGAEILVSACPFCEETFEGGLEQRPGALKYRDFTQVVVDAL